MCNNNFRNDVNALKRQMDIYNNGNNFSLREIMHNLLLCALGKKQCILKVGTFLCKSIYQLCFKSYALILSMS